VELIYGTTNKAKMQAMKKIAEPLGIKLLSLDDVGTPKLNVEENGNSPLENAKIKALAYYKVLKRPLFSCDSGLYIDEVDDARQPGVNIRGVGDVMDDDAAVAYYAGLAGEFGGRITARYRNAIVLVLDENSVHEYMNEDIESERFAIVSKPHGKRVAGFPLDGLSVHIGSGKYYYDMDSGYEKLINEDDGFAAFFKRILNIE